MLRAGSRPGTEATVGHVTGADLGEQVYANLPESLNLTLAVGELPHGAVGRYDPNTRTVTVAESVIAEDARIVAVVLVHELQHALDRTRAALDLLDVDLRQEAKHWSPDGQESIGEPGSCDGQDPI